MDRGEHTIKYFSEMIEHTTQKQYSRLWNRWESLCIGHLTFEIRTQAVCQITDQGSTTEQWVKLRLQPGGSDVVARGLVHYDNKSFNHNDIR